MAQGLQFITSAMQSLINDIYKTFGSISKAVQKVFMGISEINENQGNLEKDIVKLKKFVEKKEQNHNGRKKINSDISLR